MSAPRRRATFAACACACAFVFAGAAPLSDAEKRLLMSGMSASAATESGKAADASALERIIAIGDPALVQAFDSGMRVARLDAMPPAIEALVVKHFADASVGAALRAFTPRYATRALFDLHYARIQATYQSAEPSFGEILRTDQAGVDEPLLRTAPRFPVRAAQLNPAVDFLARRKYPGAVPLLLAALEASYAAPTGAPQYNAVLDDLLAYPSIDVWRQANAEVERLKRAGRIPEPSYAAARRKLDPIMADPDVVMTRIKGREVFEAFAKRRDALVPGAAQIAPLARSDLPRYVEEQARYLGKQEEIAAQLADEGVDYDIASAYGRLGAMTRFRLRDPSRAVGFLEKAAKGRDLYGQVALADTYQLELRDKPNALRAYELALHTASERGRRFTPYARPGDAMNEFWKAWLAQEIEFLRTGTAFQGRVPEEVIGGFWESMWVWARVALEDFPDWGSPQAYAPRAGFASAGGFGIQAPAAPANAGLASIDRKDLGSRLAAVPPSRLALIVTLRHISALPDANAILRELARHDPSGYWTTIALGTVAHHEARGAAGGEEAARNGVAEALPGIASTGDPTPLAAAARRHLQSRALRVVEKNP